LAEPSSAAHFTITTLDLLTGSAPGTLSEPTEPRDRRARSELGRSPGATERRPTGFWWGLAIGAAAALVGLASLAAAGLIPPGIPASWVGAAASPAPVAVEPPGPTGPSWADLAITQAEVKGDFLRLAGGDREIATSASYSGPIDVTLVARAEKNSVRIHAFDTARVIFNWDAHPGELRVHRPDGLFGAESGSLATAAFAPAADNAWHTFRWQITAGGMTIWVDGQAVFTESRPNDLSASRPVRVSSCDSAVDVRSLTVAKMP
jgi:hypothetical protein